MHWVRVSIAILIKQLIGSKPGQLLVRCDRLPVSHLLHPANRRRRRQHDSMNDPQWTIETRPIQHDVEMHHVELFLNNININNMQGR